MDELKMLGTLLTKPEPAPEAVHRGRRQLQKKIRGPVRRRAAWLAGGLGLATAAAAAAVVIASPGSAPPSAPNASPATAGQILLAAATTAERTPERPGRYWHVKLQVWDALKPQPDVEESWFGRDGRTWSKDPESGRVTKDRFPRPLYLGGTDLSISRLQTLPADPQTLMAWIDNALVRSGASDSGGRPDAAARKQWVLDGLISLICTLPTPPKVRAAAFRAIASYPGVKSLGGVQGGQGLRVPSRGGDQPVRLVIDPATSQVRDTNSMITNDGSVSSVPDGGHIALTTGWANELPR